MSKFETDARVTGISETEIKAKKERIEKASEHIDRGLDFHRKGLLDKAIVEYKEAIKLNANNPDVHSYLGVAIITKGTQTQVGRIDKKLLDEGIKECEKAIDLDPAYPSVHNNLGNALETLGRLDEAIEEYKKEIDLNPDIAEAYINLGLAQSKKKLHEEAIRACKKGVELDENDAWAHLNLGMVLGEGGKIDEAIEKCRKAIKLDSQCPYVHLSLGRYLEHKVMIRPDDEKLREEIIEEYKKEIEVSDCSQAHAALGGAYAWEGEFDKAIEKYEKVIELEPDDPNHHLSFGIILLMDGQYERMIEEFRKVKELDHEFERVNELTDEIGFAVQMLLDKYEEDKAKKEPKPPEHPKITFEDVIGLDEIKEKVRWTIRLLNNPDIMENFNTALRRRRFPSWIQNILLYGPPGCGKTLIAKVIANECGILFINVAAHEILSKWVGENEKKLHNVFEEARRNAPAIIFFDEVDSIGGRKDLMSQHFEITLVNQFKMELDDLRGNILVITATNKPWDVDPALQRSGRLGKQILIPPPDFETRVEMFKRFLEEAPVPVSAIDFNTLSKLTECYSGADIERICGEVVNTCVMKLSEGGFLNREDFGEITTKDFSEVIKKEKSSLIPWFKEFLAQVGYSEEKELYVDLVEIAKKCVKRRDVEGYL